MSTGSLRMAEGLVSAISSMLTPPCGLAIIAGPYPYQIIMNEKIFKQYYLHVSTYIRTTEKPFNSRGHYGHTVLKTFVERSYLFCNSIGMG